MRRSGDSCPRRTSREVSESWRPSTTRPAWMCGRPSWSGSARGALRPRRRIHGRGGRRQATGRQAPRERGLCVATIRRSGGHRGGRRRGHPRGHCAARRFAKPRSIATPSAHSRSSRPTGRFPPTSPSTPRCAGARWSAGPSTWPATWPTHRPPRNRRRSLAERIRIVAEDAGLSVEIWDAARIEKERFGGLMGVSAGSDEPPRFVILRHSRGGDAPTPPSSARG